MHMAAQCVVPLLGNKAVTAEAEDQTAAFDQFAAASIWQTAARLQPQEKYDSHNMNTGHDHQMIGKCQHVSGRLVAPPAASQGRACTSSSATPQQPTSAVHSHFMRRTALQQHGMPRTSATPPNTQQLPGFHQRPSKGAAKMPRHKDNSHACITPATVSLAETLPAKFSVDKKWIHCLPRGAAASALLLLLWGESSGPVAASMP
jgi:hypothetical protein